MARIVTLALVFFSLAGSVAAQETCGTPATLDDGWAIAGQADLGFDAAKLCELDKLLSRWPQQNIHAVVVVRHGKLAMERYFPARSATEKHDLRSITKSVTSLLIGIARSEGKFPNFDTPVIGQLPEYAALRTPSNSQITLRHLLTMSAGWDWDETKPYADPTNSEITMEAQPDPAAYVLQRPILAPPGTMYAYNSGGSMLLGMVLGHGVGRRLDDYAREKLFVPLDIADTAWHSFAGRTEPFAHNGLRLRTRDTAKIGQLLLTDGAWKDRQVVPKGWVAESTAPRLNGDGLYFYGYQWWLGRSFAHGREVRWTAGIGYGGQRLYVVPDLDLVVMINASNYAGPLQSIVPLAIFRDLVLAAVKD